jgi:hypothetical protein
MNIKPKICDLHLGESYGENEIRFLNNFKEFYYDVNDAKRRILNKKKYVVVGRKGTGKTLLANVVADSLKDTYSISVVESLKDFVFYELTNFQGLDVSPTKYVPIFEWMIYVNIAKNIVQKSSKFSESRIETLSKFLKYFGHISGDLKPEKTIEMTRKYQDGASGSLKLFDFGVSAKSASEEIEKQGVRSYLENIENLKSYVTNTLLENNSMSIIFYDELDDKFSDTVEYKSGIVSFLSAIEKVNSHFLLNDLPAKLCAVIRSDIVNKLNSPNLNRIFEDNAIFLNWDAAQTQDTELFDMLAHKIKQSSSYYKNKNSENVFEELIPKYISGEYFKIYILHRTLGRPRDIIRMLTFIQEEYGVNLDRFEANAFKNTSMKYSSYLKREVKSELIGHVSDENLERYFQFLTTIGKRAFTYNVAIKKNETHSIFDSGSKIKTMLADLFKAGAIANVVRRAKREGGNVYYWSYNDENFSANLEMDFEIHPGLWDTLQIPKPKDRLS